MKKWMEEFWKEEEAMGTVEIILIIAVLIAIALAFRTQITEFVNGLMESIFNDDVKNNLGSSTS